MHFQVVAHPYLLAMMTLAPSADNSLAIPLPSPVPPPVMKATFPEKVSGGSMQLFAGGKYLAAPLEYLRVMGDLML